MSHVMRLVALTDELITVITGFTANTDADKFNTCRETALRTLRQSNHARTNQFEVQHQLEGLQEKFLIYDEDELAHALRQRLDELAERSTKWTPEVLQLLLHLSDKPLQNSNVDDIEFLKPPEKAAEPHYRWEELAAEDPLLRDKHVWRNIDYGAESSDDEGKSLNSESSIVTEITTISNDDSSSHRGDLTTPTDYDKLTIVEKSQFWQDNTRVVLDKAGPLNHEQQSRTILITELQAIREVFFLLSGLPTSLFEIALENAEAPQEKHDPHSSQIPSNTPIIIPVTNLAIPTVRPASRFALTHASPHVFQKVMAHFASYGTSIGLLRAWVGNKQAIPLLQSFEEEVTERLRQLDTRLCDMQKRYVALCRDIKVSLIDVQAEVSFLMQPMLKLSDLVKSLIYEPYSHAFRYLELLYKETCTAQMAGNDDMYRFMGTIFFNCFQTYLRPIRRWMEEGEVSRKDHVFFISETQEEIELVSLWQSRYKLRKTSMGALHAPKFLQPASNKIFITGKSVAVLKQLGKSDRERRRPINEEPKLDFGTVCDLSLFSLAPFPELFDIAFDQWIQSKHDAVSSSLRDCLFDECGLRASLSALENIFFMADGAAATSFGKAIFEKLDSGKTSWNDRFTLTELAQATLGSLSIVTAGRLRASVNAAKHLDVQKSRKSVKSLVDIALSYNLPWPVQIIITKDTVPSYRKIFSFLLQIRRSTYMLQGVRLDNSGKGDENVLYYNLRSRLQWFNTTLYGYLTDLVIRTNTSQMRAALAEAADVDEMIELHRTYVKRLIDQALLGTKLEPIYKTVITILDLSIQLSDARMVHESKQSRDEISQPSRGNSSRRQSWRRSPLRVNRGRPERTRDLDSDPDDSDNDGDLSIIDAPEMRLSYVSELCEMRRQFDQLCRFVASGLRGVARAGSEPNWDMLADKLESGLGFVV